MDSKILIIHGKDAVETHECKERGEYTLTFLLAASVEMGNVTKARLQFVESGGRIYKVLASFVSQAYTCGTEREPFLGNTNSINSPWISLATSHISNVLIFTLVPLDSREPPFDLSRLCMIVEFM